MINDKPDKKDIDLARKWNLFLMGKASSPLDNSSGLVYLNQYKNVRELSTLGLNSTALWDSINTKSITPTPVYHLKRHLGWVAVAAALILTFISYHFLFDLNEDRVIASSFDKKTSVTLADNSEIVLRPYSTLTLKNRDEHQYHYSLSGEALFNVTKNKNRTFWVETSHGLIEVIGTQFTLADYKTYTDIYLIEGSVSLINLSTGESILIKPGESARINSYTITLSSSSLSAHTDWIKEQLSLASTPVSEALLELQQHFNVRIIMPDSLLQKTISGTLKLTSRDESLEQFGKLFNGFFSNSENDIYTFESN